MGFLSRLFQSKPDHSPIKSSVRFDEEKITHSRRDGTLETVRWDELVEITIMTTGDGPFSGDLVWILSGAPTSGCTVPGDADGIEELLVRLQQLPSFDNEAVVSAMGSTSLAHFLCWRRQPVA